MFSKVAAVSLAFFAVASSPTVRACEGECIVGITKAFIGNYSSPVHQILNDIATQISTQLLSPNSRPSDPTTLIQPILKAYTNTSYESMRTAIFPSYFHGKCQRFSKDGQDPPGCPDPDCPVVCGTPGSLVHFYSTLRYIAFNDTKSALDDLVSPGSSAFEQIEKMVEDAQNSRSMLKMRSKILLSHAKHVAAANANSTVDLRSSQDYITPSAIYHHSRHSGGTGGKHNSVYTYIRSSPTTSSDLAGILSQVGTRLEKACGGSATDSSDGLPDCNWETAMKAYILSFK